MLLNEPRTFLVEPWQRFPRSKDPGLEIELNWLAWKVFLLVSQEEKPASALVDLYKLSFQGILGSEHLLRDAEAEQRLWEEWGKVEASNGESLFESARPDGALGRLHLRPWKARGGEWETILRAMQLTSERHWGDHEELRALWISLAKESQVGQFPYPGSQLLIFLAQLEEKGFPLVHHSLAYRNAYHPAYRVVSWQVWQSLITEDPTGTALTQPSPPGERVG
jgi:hypothetical protein